MGEDETFEIGYREDAVFWVTTSSQLPDSASAERLSPRRTRRRGLDEVAVNHPEAKEA
jgi:hypothetical protein